MNSVDPNKNSKRPKLFGHIYEISLFHRNRDIDTTIIVQFTDWKSIPCKPEMTTQMPALFNYRSRGCIYLEGARQIYQIDTVSRTRGEVAIKIHAGTL